MSELKRLLQGVEVEWKELGEVANFRRGSFPQPYGNSEWYNGIGAMPFVQVNDVAKNMQLVSNTKNKISKLAQQKSVFVPKSTIIVTLQGSIGRVAITQYDAYVDRTLAVFESYKIEINKKYFAYQLSDKFNIEKENARGSTIKTITKEEFSKFSIPIPYPDHPEKSLKIQEEIVRILDSLSEETNKLTTALQNELDSHQKRYEYHREELFKFEGKEVEWKTLSDITSATKNIQWNTTNKMYKYIDLSSVDKEKRLITDTIEINSKNAPSRAQKIIIKKDIIFATTRPTQLRVCIISNEFSNQIASTGFCVLRANKDKVLPKWIFHHLTTNVFKNYLEENQSGSAYPAISDSKVKNYKIPIPHPNDSIKSLEEQERIVKILDKLDTITQSITTEIKKEIELRNKQYEYYRDQLLSFPK